MNKPRDRQPRGSRGDSGHEYQHGRNTQSGKDLHGRGEQLSGPSHCYSTPTIQQVLPGARVSIVLKQDQSTGREVQGSVGEVLTRGNHPRGIKVRLQDGRIGRVQRMAGRLEPATRPTSISGISSTRHSNGKDVNDEPPPRTLADFLPEPEEKATVKMADESLSFSTATAVCPICELFEGDDTAVSYHVESHLT